MIDQGIVGERKASWPAEKQVSALDDWGGIGIAQNLDLGKADLLEEIRDPRIGTGLHPRKDSTSHLRDCIVRLPKCTTTPSRLPFQNGFHDLGRVVDTARMKHQCRMDAPPIEQNKPSAQASSINDNGFIDSTFSATVYTSMIPEGIGRRAVDGNCHPDWITSLAIEPRPDDFAKWLVENGSLLGSAVANWISARIGRIGAEKTD